MVAGRSFGLVCVNKRLRCLRLTRSAPSPDDADNVLESNQRCLLVLSSPDSLHQQICDCKHATCVFIGFYTLLASPVPPPAPGESVPFQGDLILCLYLVCTDS